MTFAAQHKAGIPDAFKHRLLKLEFPFGVMEIDAVLYSTGVVVEARCLNGDWRLAVERRRYDAWLKLRPKSTIRRE